MTNLTYCALIPARNESARIAATIAALKSRREVGAVVVIDDASTDETSSVAEKAGATRVIRLDTRLGKGGALEAGIAAVGSEYDVLLFLDADLGDSAAECTKLITPIETDECDMTIGTLPPDPALVAAGTPGGGMGIVVKYARTGIQKRTGQAFTQPLSGQRAIRRTVLDALGGKLSRGFGVEVGLTISAIQKGFRVCEVETKFRHRVTGHDFKSTLHRARQLVDVASALRGS